MGQFTQQGEDYTDLYGRMLKNESSLRVPEKRHCTVIGGYVCSQTRQHDIDTAAGCVGATGAGANVVS